MTPLADDITAVDAATTRCWPRSAAWTDADLDHPSLCEGWTRAHVVAHLARNAEAIARLVDWAVTGEPREMYPGGQDARDAEIEAGAHRGAEEQVADLSSTAAALAQRLPLLARGTATAEVEGRGGFVIASADLPFMRLREVVYHHADLAAGYSFSDVDGDLLARFIEDAVRRLSLSRRAPGLTLRADEGDSWVVGDGAAVVTGIAGRAAELARPPDPRRRGLRGTAPRAAARGLTPLAVSLRAP